MSGSRGTSRRGFFRSSGAGLAAGAFAPVTSRPTAGSGGASYTVPVETVEFDPGSGRLRVGYGDGRSLQLRTRFAAGTAEIDAGERAAVRALRFPSGGAAWRERSEAHGLEFECAASGGPELDFWVRITNRGSRRAGVRLLQDVAGIPLGGSCFAPCTRSEYDLKESGVAFGYRGAPDLAGGRRGGAVAIPMACFYDAAPNVGFTAAAHIDSPTPTFVCEADPAAGRVGISRRIEVEPGASVTIRHFIVRHEGCWRPGLRWVRDAYPEYFMAPAGAVEATHGSFVYTNTAEPELCDEFARTKVKNVEIHWTVPFFGKAVPEEEPWVKMVDDKWNTIKLTTDPGAPREDAPYDEVKRYVARVTRPSGTRAAVLGFIRDLRKRGMQSFLYFNPTECWEVYANQHFPECILRHPDGSPVMTWFDHVVMDCRPETRWGQYQCEEMERLLRMYPEADGIFMDQSASDGADGKVTRLTNALGEIVRRHGKRCYWNGPYLVDLLKHAVGLLGELGPVQGEQIKWLTIGNKVCCGLGHTEAQYQRNLLNGLWPPGPSLIHARGFRVSDEQAACKPLPRELEDLHGRYLHLYELYPGKTWFLGADPLKLPEGVQGNIFERPGGEYLVALVAPGRGIADGECGTDARVSIRVPDAAAIRAVSLRSVNLPGREYRVPFEVRDGRVTVTVPWLGSASLLRLARSAAGSAAKMPAPPPAVRRPQQPVRVVHASVRSQGVALDGNSDSLQNGLKTNAPLPRVPARKAFLNGKQIGLLESGNSRHWHSRVAVGTLKHISVDLTGVLRRRNELTIEPDGPADFFKIRNVSMMVVLSDGRVIQSSVDRNTYSTCAHALAEGKIGSPLRIPVEFSAADLPE